jgi:hypothetical protein
MMFVGLLLTSLVPSVARAQFTVSTETNIPAADVLKILQSSKECVPGQPLTVLVLKQRLPHQYTTYAVSFYDANDVAIPVHSESNLGLYTPSGVSGGAPIADRIMSASTDEKLSHAIQHACKFVKTLITVQVMDATSLTLSSDVRGRGQGLQQDLTGRVTHTDATNMYVIVNGEHALLDCFEHRKGCTPLAPGTYYANLDLDKRSIWINHVLPVTHQPLRDHYVIAGAW